MSGNYRLFAVDDPDCLGEVRFDFDDKGAFGTTLLMPVLIDTPELDAEDLANDSEDGSIQVYARFRKREIRIPFFIEGGSIDQLYDRWKDLQKALLTGGYFRHHPQGGGPNTVRIYRYEKTRPPALWDGSDLAARWINNLHQAKRVVTLEAQPWPGGGGIDL